MKNTSPKMIALLVSTLMILSMLAILPIRPATALEELPDYEAVDWQSGLAGPIEFPTIEGSISGASVQTVESFETTPPVGTTVWDWYLWAISRNDYGGPKATMTLRARGENVEVWVQDDMRFPFTATYSDPRNAYPRNYTVTDEMAQYIAETFDSIIYPTDTTYFGKPLDRDGSGNIFIGSSYPTAPPNWWYWIEAPDNPQRVILKVLNYRDTNYYDPTYPTYVAGFYQSTYTRTYYKRNMIHIDCWQWWRRVGPEGYHWYADTTVPADRANLYESVVAHEFQHNIHRDWNAGDETFMNEGCSEYAQILCGWPHTLWSHINNYLYTPDNSLTVWGDQGDINILADYGAAALWVTYLSDHYGGSNTIKYFVQAGVPGPPGVNAALEHFGYRERFDDVFHDWRLANLIHSDFPGCKRYNYTTLDLGRPPAISASRYTVSGIPVPLRKGTDFGPTWTYLGYNTGISTIGPYGSDYIVLNNWDKLGIIHFDGDDFLTLPSGQRWTLTADGWWSGQANLMDTLLYGKIYVDPKNPTLEITTKYDTENQWDFGFVQVSKDGGKTWASQSNSYTTSSHDPGAHPDIVANLPGLTGQSTGYPEWVTMTFDLTAYARKTVMIGFRYMTDWSTFGAGWYIKEAKVSDKSLALSVCPDADFQVTVVYAIEFDDCTVYIPLDMWLRDETETGLALAYTNSIYVILVVSPTMRRGVVDYAFKVTPL
jgi:hypothetical protein